MTKYIHSSSSINAKTKFSGEFYIGPFCIIGNHNYQHSNWSCNQFLNNPTMATIIGNGARLLGHSIICSGTQIGKNFRCDYHSLIGESCSIGDDVVVEYAARIYDFVKIGSGSFVSGFICNDSIIGSNCNIQGALIHKRVKSGLEAAPVIEDNCFVGKNATIIGDITVRENSFIAAGAVVTKNTEPGFLYAGIPARKIKRQQWY